jgi:Uma2 family endonuclease
MEAAVVEPRIGRMSSAEFRAFQDMRPDHERWELIDGVPVMMTPPTIAHNHIAGNLERLLTSCLERYAPSLIATQRPGVDLASGDYRPEPDVGVIDADYAPDQRFVEKAYLLAEVVSPTDLVGVAGSSGRWIDVKRDIYRSHKHCEAVLIIEQSRMEVAIDLKIDGAWVSSVARGAGAEIAIPELGFRCFVADLYEGTPLSPRPTTNPQP